MERNARYSEALLPKLFELGLMAIDVPEQYGGAGGLHGHGQRALLGCLAAAREVPGQASAHAEHQLLLDVDRDRLVVASQTWEAWEETVVSIYDVTDPAAPTLMRRSHLEGRLVASRAADGARP